MSGARLALVVAAVAVAAVVQGVSGFGFALASMPLLSVLVGVERALAIQTTLGIASSAATSIRGRAHIQRATMARILLATLTGMPLGWFVLEHVEARWLKLVVGVVVGALAILLALKVRIRASGVAVDVVSGFLSGILATSTGTNGPPLVIALSGRGMSAMPLRATLSGCLAVDNMVVFVALLVTGRIDAVVVRGVAASLPVLLLAWWVGNRIFGRLDQRRYERILIALLLASAAIAITSAFR